MSAAARLETIAGSPSMRSSASFPTRPARTASASAASASRVESPSRAAHGVDEREQAAPAALDVQHGLIRHQDHVGAGDACGTRFAPLTLGPRQRRAVGLGGVGGGEHDRLAGADRTLLGGRGTQPLDGAGERELGAAHALDEVAAPADAERLEVGERVVEHREAALDALGEHLLAGDDAVALEQQLGQRATALDRPCRPLGPASEHRLGQRPASLHL